MQRLLLFASLSAALATPIALAAPASAPAPTRDHSVVPEDYFSIGTITALAVSPDGRHVAYIESRWEPPEDKRNADLWVVDIATRVSRRLTFDRASENSPQWSPDGSQIYYTASYKRAGEDAAPYNGKKQVWRIAPAGGEPQAVTRVKDGIDSFELSHDGRSVYFVILEEQTDDEWKELRKQFKDLKYGHGITKFSQLHRLDLQSWRTEKLVDDRRIIRAFTVAPDQSRIAMSTTPDDEIIHNEGWSRIDLYDTRTKQITTATPDGWRQSHPSPFGWIDGLAWSGDSGALAFGVGFDGYPTLLYTIELTGAAPRLTDLPRPLGVTIEAASPQWRGDARTLCFIGADRTRSRIYSCAQVRDGRADAPISLTSGDVVIDGFSFSRNGTVAVALNTTLSSPPDLFVVQSSGLARLTHVNPQVDTWKLPQISLVQWKAPDGREVEGVLELPPDHRPGDKPLPLIVEIHGGPTAATEFKLDAGIYGRTFLPAKGYAILSPNYRGSTGYGDAFLTELIGRENDIEVKDILAGVDALIARGLADPARLGVMGWSNGGFLTNALITQTDRFKAASSGAGVVDQVIQWATEDTPGHVINYNNAMQPWGDPTIYRAQSPLYRLNRVVTPTLIHVGENDERVPAAHSRGLYRGLKFYVRVPTELLVYPGEGHGLTTYKHRKAKLEWDHAWFDRYVLGSSARGSVR
jgi:dipeptidyl aminopeptidase/acylaminoacyl peptidase